MEIERPELLPIGVVLRTIDAEPGWWLESARRLDAAGYAGLWAWDHFVGRGDETVPVVESWTILSMAAASTSQATVGTFVANVMNRHPALLARGVHAPDRERRPVRAGNRDRRSTARARAVRDGLPRCGGARGQVTEAVAVIRALWQGGPVTRQSEFYPLDEAVAHPVPIPPPPNIIGGETRAGARLAGRTAMAGRPCTPTSRQTCPPTSRRSRTSGRSRADQRLIVGFEGSDWLSDEPIDDSPWVTEPRETWERWRDAGADGVTVLARSTSDVDALVNAVDRW